MNFKSTALLALASVSANINVKTVWYPEENYWEILAANGTQMCHGGPYQHEKTNYPETCYLPGTGYTLKCHDDADDGWHGGWIEVNGIKYCENFEDGHLETHALYTGAPVHPWSRPT